MRIQHNIAAMNSYRNYTANNKAVAKNLEKLSSGYKINRAGDDAAGLAISEKMRAQITGIKTAQKNAKDGISLVQTAEGALTEVHSMLNRMVELADQSANGTYDNEVDRANLQKEVTALSTEIDRIADSSNFNGIKLLDGSLAIKDAAVAPTPEKQLKAINLTETTAGTAVLGRQDAAVAKNVYDTAKIKGTDTTFDAYEIKFKNKDGVEKTITLAESAKTGVGVTAETLATALQQDGKGLALTTLGGENEANLKEFRDLFGITGDTTGLNLQAKEGSGKAEMVSVKVATDADIGTAITNAAAGTAVALGNTSTKAEKAGYAVDLDAKATVDGAGTNFNAGKTLKIGDTTYEVVTGNAAPKTAGATGITAGADDAGTAAALAAQLKKDGYDVEVSGNDKAKLVFTNMDQLKEKQGGNQVSASNANVRIDKQAAVAQKTELTMAAPTTNNTSYNVKINYLNAAGENVTKELSYTSGTDAASSATKLAEELNKDADLRGLFDIKADAGKITMEARGTGTGAGSFLGIEHSDTAAGKAIAATTVAGAYEGKTMTMKTGENMKAGDTVTVNGKVYEFSKDSDVPVGKDHTRLEIGADGAASMKNLSAALTKDGIKHTIDKDGKMTFADKDVVVETVKSGGLTLQIGDTAENFNKLTVSVNDMHTKALGIGNLDITDQTKGAAAVEKLRTAINTVSSTRGDLGATQNRLDHTINNLTVMHENIQDAEASIRDVDVADEMMAYTKNNILVQSAQAMLAQANQLPQGVLQLLQ